MSSYLVPFSTSPVGTRLPGARDDDIYTAVSRVLAGLDWEPVPELVEILDVSFLDIRRSDVRDAVDFDYDPNALVDGQRPMFAGLGLGAELTPDETQRIHRFHFRGRGEAPLSGPFGDETSTTTDFWGSYSRDGGDLSGLYADVQVDYRGSRKFALGKAIVAGPGLAIRTANGLLTLASSSADQRNDAMDEMAVQLRSEKIAQALHPWPLA